MGDLSLGLNADSARNVDKNSSGFGLPPGNSLTTKANGIALYGNYQITKQFRLGLRGEMLKTIYSALGTSPINKQEKELTLTGDYTLAKNFDLLGEVRYDRGDYNLFGAGLNGFVDSAGNNVNNDTTVVVKAIVLGIVGASTDLGMKRSSVPACSAAHNAPRWCATKT